jgi:hypothetical protein
VTNSSNGSVLFFRSRACGTSTWGADLLGSSVLSHGEQGSWQLTPGCYDFRATPAEVGLDYLYFENVQLAAGATVTRQITTWPVEQ